MGMLGDYSNWRPAPRGLSGARLGREPGRRGLRQRRLIRNVTFDSSLLSKCLREIADLIK